MAKVGRVNKSKSIIAMEYIRENIDKKKRYEIIEHLQEVTKLKVSTLETIYKDIKDETNINKSYNARMKKESEIIKYKGRDRKFFNFDDTDLYKGLI